MFRSILPWEEALIWLWSAERHRLYTQFTHILQVNTRATGNIIDVHVSFDSSQKKQQADYVLLKSSPKNKKIDLSSASSLDI